MNRVRTSVLGSARASRALFGAPRRTAGEIRVEGAANHTRGRVCSPTKAAKLASDFDQQNRDENVDYYVAKLDELVSKFRGVTGGTTTKPAQQERLAF